MNRKFEWTVLLVVSTVAFATSAFVQQRPNPNQQARDISRHQTVNNHLNQQQGSVSDENAGLELVPLQTKPPDNEKPTEKSVEIRRTTKELLRSLGYVDTSDNNVVGNHHGRDLSASDPDLLDLPEPSTEQYDDDDDDEDDDDDDDDDYISTTETPTSTQWTTIRQDLRRLTSTEKVRTGTPTIRRRQDVISTPLSTRTTKLYPVGRLWDQPEEGQSREEENQGNQRTVPTVPGTRPAMPGIMAILDAAFSCIWSGLGFECFSLKVVPMFRAMMGIPPIFPFPPMPYQSSNSYDDNSYYVLPRNTDVAQDVANGDPSPRNQNEGEVQGRRRRLGLRLVKMAMIALATIKTLAIPALSVLSILSGKAIVFSLAAIVITMAFGWSASGFGKFAADRRVLDDNRDRHSPLPYQHYYGYNTPSSYSSHYKM